MKRILMLYVRSIPESGVPTERNNFFELVDSAGTEQEANGT